MYRARVTVDGEEVSASVQPLCGTYGNLMNVQDRLSAGFSEAIDHYESIGASSEVCWGFDGAYAWMNSIDSEEFDHLEQGRSFGPVVVYVWRVETPEDRDRVDEE